MEGRRKERRNEGRKLKDEQEKTDNLIPQLICDGCDERKKKSIKKDEALISILKDYDKTKKNEHFKLLSLVLDLFK